MVAREFSTFVGATVAGVFLGGLLLVGNGCTGGEFNFVYHCKPDAGDECARDGGVDGAGLSPESLTCEERGGDCVDLGTSKFTENPFLAWIGDFNASMPECPERATSEYYMGYGGLYVFPPACEKCTCSAPTCVLPHAIGIDPIDGCPSGIVDNYTAPQGWDGSCSSPQIWPGQNVASVWVPSATVSECMPSTPKPMDPPKFAPSPTNFANGVFWETSVKACRGIADGSCAISGQTCVPSATPPPPEFRYCVEYSLPVDELNLPECPAVFPERHVFYEKTEGEMECTECKCSAPVNSQCVASFSVFQSPVCGTSPLPHFENVVGGGCHTVMPWPVGAISAKMAIDSPGKCEPTGGELVGEVKPINPTVFCCKPLPGKSTKE